MTTPLWIPSCFFRGYFKRIHLACTVPGADFTALVFLLACNTLSLGQLPAARSPFQPPYAVLQQRLDGGYYLTTSKILKFKYSEEYHVSPANNKLTYKVYDRLRSTSLGVDHNGTPIVSGSPLKAVAYGDNRYDLDVSAFGLVVGQYYVLEVENDKNEKRWLRFKLD